MISGFELPAFLFRFIPRSQFPETPKVPCNLIAKSPKCFRFLFPILLHISQQYLQISCWVIILFQPFSSHSMFEPFFDPHFVVMIEHLVFIFLNIIGLFFGELVDNQPSFGRRMGSPRLDQDISFQTLNRLVRVIRSVRTSELYHALKRFQQIDPMSLQCIIFLNMDFMVLCSHLFVISGSNIRDENIVRQFLLVFFT